MNTKLSLDQFRTTLQREFAHEPISGDTVLRIVNRARKLLGITAEDDVVLVPTWGPDGMVVDIGVPAMSKLKPALLKLGAKTILS